MPAILPSRIPHTLEEVVVVVITEDLSLIQNLSEDENMKLLSQITFHTYWAASLFSLATVDRCEVLALHNPTKERHNWKEKYESLQQKCSAFHKELIILQEKVKVIDTLQENAKVHGSPLTLAARIFDLETSLEEEKKQLQEASEDIYKVNCTVEEDQKTLWRKAETQAEDLKSLEVFRHAGEVLQSPSMNCARYVQGPLSSRGS